MLTEKEKYGISELLHRMDRADLCSLAQTVTSRLIVPETAMEAIQAIILHTDQAIDLLKRRKVKKEFLFKYLHAKRVSIEASAEKPIVIAHVLQVWDSGGPSSSSTVAGHLAGVHLPSEEDSLPEAPAPSRNTSYTSLCSLDSGTGGGGAAAAHAQVTQFPLNALGRPPSEDDRVSDAGTHTMIMMDDHEPGSANSAAAQSLSAPSLFPSPCDQSDLVASANLSPSSPQPQVQEMADKFVKWFYELLNRTSFESSDFGPQHFWTDASAKISLQSDSGILSDAEFFHVRENGPEVCSTLSNIVQKYKLTYNPNLCADTGVRGQMDPHGLVRISACGTLHNATTCCGVFHQIFGLIRDPAVGNSWKIKFTEASLVSKAVSEVPRLTCNGDVSAMALS